MFWVRCLANVLRLITVLIYYILLNLVLLFPLPPLKGFVLGIDLIESPEAFTWRIIKLVAKDTTIETTA
jgi:hypothetical protein